MEGREIARRKSTKSGIERGAGGAGNIFKNPLKGEKGRRQLFSFALYLVL